MTWTGTYWLADSDTVVCSYKSSTQSYLVKTNGFIKIWSHNTQGGTLTVVFLVVFLEKPSTVGSFEKNSADYVYQNQKPTSVSKTGFQMYVGGYPYNWIAIGY